MSTEPDWKKYEDSVYDLLRDKYPHHSFQRDIRIIGRITRTKRQIDIAIHGEFLGHELFVAVDCKHYTSKVDIKEVEAFVGCLEDVGADFGILVTNQGYTKAAFERAKVGKVKLGIVTPMELRDFEISFYECEECDPGENHPPGVVWWDRYGNITGDTEKVRNIGRCDWCNTLHLQCMTCGEVTSIPDLQYGKLIECTGGCGTFFLVQFDRASRGVSENLNVHMPNGQ